MRSSLSTANDSTKVRQSIRQGWEEVALEYTKDRLGIFGRYASRLLDLLHPSTESRLLDVGCGSGAVALQAAAWVDANGWVIGSDVATAMLRLGQMKALQETSKVTFSQMDAERLGFGNASFDYVTCAFSLFQFQDMDQALIEMWRVLKPGGRLALSNWGPGFFTPLASLQRDLFRKFGIKPLLNNPLVFEPIRLRTLLTRSGFTTVKLIEETDDVWFNTPEQVWAFNLDMGPFPIMLRRQLSADQQRDLKRQFKAMLENLLTERGIQSTFHLIYALAEKGNVD
ncbi:MAG: class I SAM-dependent methyltransferase [Anaerolineales bacterium]